MDLSLNETLTLYFHRYDEIHALWNLYITVSLGVVGFSVSGKAFARSRSIKLVVSVAFVLFALSNLQALAGAFGAQDALRQILASKIGKLSSDRALYEAFLGTLPTSPTSALAVFHLVLDAGVLVTMWFAGKGASG